MTPIAITPEASMAAGFGWAIFTLGSIWFWLLIGVATVCIIGALENDAFGKAFATVVATVLLLTFCGAGLELKALCSWIWHHPGTTIGLFLGYLVIGSAYSIFKWYLFLKEYKRKLDDSKKKFSQYDRRSIVRDNKGRLINWMCYWPFSGLWSLLSDPFHAIYRHLTGVYDKMVDSIVGPVEKD